VRVEEGCTLVERVHLDCTKANERTQVKCPRQRIEQQPRAEAFPMHANIDRQAPKVEHRYL